VGTGHSRFSGWNISADAKATFKTARYKRVSVLDAQSARELILTAHRQGSLTFAEKAIDSILALTSGHAYFTQLLCQILWELAHANSPHDIPQIDVEMVEAAVPKVLEAGESVFEWVWDGLPSAERIIFAAIADLTGEQSVGSYMLNGGAGHHRSTSACTVLVRRPRRRGGSQRGGGTW
jgi:hypothetical protein